MSVYDESLKKHYEWKGKIGISSRVDVSSSEKLSLAYTPGVAEPCRVIQKDISKSFELTRRWNTVAVITDGTAILGLGDIGPEAGMPVMEGKAALFNAFGDIDAIPICLKTKDTDELVRTIYLMSGSFGGINLEDISAPRCFEVERKLKEICDIPIFHDDQHGTAIVVAAALINALKVVGKKIEDVKVVISGAGAAGISIGNFAMSLGCKDVIFYDKCGLITDGVKGMNPVQEELAKRSNPRKIRGGLKEAFVGADVFIGVSAPGLVSEEMVRSMARDPIMFPLANPVPEITREECINAGARVVGTGSSQNPNQINNVLVFPGVFRGALDAKATDITMGMMIKASEAIASCVSEDELCEEYIIPKAFNKEVHKRVAEAVMDEAIREGVIRK